MTKTLASLLLAGALAACAGQAEVHYSGDASTPELVAMDGDPDVMIVANADEPMFYSDHAYYLYRDRQWYRSSSHRHGWTREDQPPLAVQRIHRPTAYVHYRHRAGAPRTTYNQARAVPPAEPIEHHPPIAPPPADTPANAPIVRDHREAPPVGADPQLQAPRRDAPPIGNAPTPANPQPPSPNPLPPNQVPPVPPDGVH